MTDKNNEDGKAHSKKNMTIKLIIPISLVNCMHHQRVVYIETKNVNCFLLSHSVEFLFFCIKITY